MDARTRLKAEAHVVDRVLHLVGGQVDEEDADAVAVSLDAFVHLGLMDRARADTYRAALTAPRVEHEAWPPPDLRERATRYVESVFAALGEAPDTAAISHASSALDALKDVGAISFEQWGEWFGRFFSYGPDVEGVYLGSGSGGVFLMASEDDSDSDEDVVPPEMDLPVMDARVLIRVVTGPFRLDGGPTLTSVELYEDGLRLNWQANGMTQASHQALTTGRAWKNTWLRTRGFAASPGPTTSHPCVMTPASSTERPEKSGGGWNIHRPRLIMASSQLTPAVPADATQLDICIEGVGAIGVPLHSF